MRIQTLWVGQSLTRLEHLCLSSFVYHHENSVDLYVYEPVQNVPDGVRLCDANEIIPSDEVFTYFHGSYAGFADLFRWKLLYERGGYWIDTDMLCIRPFDFREELVFGKETDKYGKVYWNAAVGVLKFPALHPVCSYMLHRCKNPHDVDSHDKFARRLKKWWRRNFSRSSSPVLWGGAGGPKGFSYAVDRFQLNNAMQSNIVFYPVHGTLWQSLFDLTYAGDYSFFKSTRAVHLWNEMLRSNHFDKDAPYISGSLADFYEQKYVAQTTAFPKALLPAA